MTKKECEEIVARVDSNEEAVGRWNNLSELGSKYWLAKGFLEGLKSPEALQRKEVLDLVEALKYLNIHNGGHVPSVEVTEHRKCNQCVIETALYNYKKAIGEEK